jgi:hypothetical protein
MLLIFTCRITKGECTELFSYHILVEDSKMTDFIHQKTIMLFNYVKEESDASFQR